MSHLDWDEDRYSDYVEVREASLTWARGMTCQQYDRALTELDRRAHPYDYDKDGRYVGREGSA